MTEYQTRIKGSWVPVHSFLSLEVGDIIQDSSKTPLEVTFIEKGGADRNVQVTMTAKREDGMTGKDLKENDLKAVFHLPCASI